MEIITIYFLLHLAIEKKNNRQQVQYSKTNKE